MIYEPFPLLISELGVIVAACWIEGAVMSVNAMFGPNHFKLGIFSANADGGLAITRVPERWRASWKEIAELAQMAERAGFEFFLPIARWKGFGGETNARHHSFETLSFAAALSGPTERMTLFATVHVPIVPPVFAAKALATIDHASGGRAGLNIVCGWNQPEFDMFGITKAEAPYDQGYEWYEIFMGVLEGGDPFDYKGKYYDLKGLEGAPPPVQKPRPVTLSAAFSPPGREFAVKTSDCLFTTFATIEGGAETIADVRARAEGAGREIDVYTTCHVVCRPSQQEAEDYYEYYAVEMADQTAVNLHMEMKKTMAFSHDPKVFQGYKKRFAGGAGTYPLIGTPERIADELVAMHEIGFAGTTVSFVNFLEELPFFVKEVLPRLEAAGLRAAP
jgi:alkanesulfonate monooxygenase SsuD/methylene tetrahydromethanopterin reductase-like flavin-dependent oxidoreductase (luciferase family)